jgi:hypothetical protein
MTPVSSSESTFDLDIRYFQSSMLCICMTISIISITITICSNVIHDVLRRCDSLIVTVRLTVTVLTPVPAVAVELENLRSLASATVSVTQLTVVASNDTKLITARSKLSK